MDNIENSIQSQITNGPSIQTVQSDGPNITTVQNDGINITTTQSEIPAINSIVQDVPQVQTVIQDGNAVSSIINAPFVEVTSVNGMTGDVVTTANITDFEPNHYYLKGSMINHNGSVYAAKENFTSGATYNASDWTAVGTKGDKGDKGDTGDKGDAASVVVGTTTTTASGTNAKVTNTGTSSAAILNFEIPRGKDGGLNAEVVDVLPEVGDSQKLYLTPANNPSGVDKEVSGKIVTLENVQSEDLVSFGMSGDTYQQTYSGKNLIKMSPSLFSQSKNGVTYKYDEKTGIITLDGTCTANNTCFTFAPSADVISVDGDYTLSVYYVGGSVSGDTNDTVVQLQTSDYKIAIKSRIKNYDVISTHTKTASLVVNNIRIDNAVVLKNYRIKVMLEKGNESTGFEKYNGGVVAPNPEMPQAIESVTGEQNIEIVGKNLFDIDDIANSYSPTDQTVLEKLNDNTIRATALASGGYRFAEIPLSNLDLLLGKKITVSMDVVQGPAVVSDTSFALFWINTENKTYGTALLGNDERHTGHYSYTVNVPESIPSGQNALGLFLYAHRTSSPANTYSDFSNIQIEIGEKESSYASYIKKEVSVNLGKNLFDKNRVSSIYGYVSGDTIVSGSTTKTLYIKCEPNTTYTVQKTNAGTEQRFCVFDTVNVPAVGEKIVSFVGHTAGVDDSASLTITTGSNSKYLAVFYMKTDVTSVPEQEILDSIQIEKGPVATEYADFIGVVTKNILSSKWGAYSYTDSGVRKDDSGAYGTVDLIKVSPSTQYIVSRNGKGVAMNIFEYGPTKTFIRKYYSGSGASFTTSATAQYLAMFRSQTGGIEKMQLEAGSEITPYEPFISSKLELHKLGNYQDRIYKDVDGWKIEKRINFKALNDKWSNDDFSNRKRIYGNVTNFGISGDDANIKPGSNDELAFAIYKSFTNKTANYLLNNAVDCFCISASNTISFRKQDAATSMDIVNIVNGTPFYYVLATPKILTIANESIINQLENALKTKIELGFSTVKSSSADLPAYLDLTYKEIDPTNNKDEWVWIENRYERIGGDDGQGGGSGIARWGYLDGNIDDQKDLKEKFDEVNSTTSQLADGVERIDGDIVGINAELGTKLSRKFFDNQGSSVYKKVVITDVGGGTGAIFNSRCQTFLYQGPTNAATYMGNLYEIGTNHNGKAVSTGNRYTHIKNVFETNSSKVILYIALDAYNYCEFWSYGNITITDSTAEEFNGITSQVNSIPIARVSDIPKSNTDIFTAGNLAVATDTPSGWNAALGQSGTNGLFCTWYSSSNKFAKQPSQYGFLETFRAGNDLYQRWHQQSSGKILYRSGNATGWAGKTDGSWNTVPTNDDLANYVAKTDYASATVSGIARTNEAYGTGVYDNNGTIAGSTRTYEQYEAGLTRTVISKGTLENVIVGKNLVHADEEDESEDIEQSITTSMIQNNAITTDKLEDTSVTTRKLANKAVTKDKIDWTGSIGSYSTSEVNTGATWVNGKPIYKKTINFGTLPNTSTKTVYHNISNIQDIIKTEGMVKFSGGVWVTLPYESSSSFAAQIEMVVYSDRISIIAAVDRSGGTAYVTIYYTKN